MELTPDRLEALIKAFKAARPQYQTVEGSFAKCLEASQSFCQMLKAHNVSHTLIFMDGRKTPLTDPHPFWFDYDLENVCHFVVRLSNDLCYDWTIKQFDQQAESPGVFTFDQLEQDWDSVFPYIKTMALSQSLASLTIAIDAHTTIKGVS